MKASSTVTLVGAVALAACTTTGGSNDQGPTNIGFPPERGATASEDPKGNIIFAPQIGPLTPTWVSSGQCVFENQGNGRYVAERGEHTNAQFQSLYSDYTYRGESGSTDINDDCACPINWSMEEGQASAIFYEATGYRANFDIIGTPSCNEGSDPAPTPEPEPEPEDNPEGGCQCDGRGEEPDGPGGEDSGTGGNDAPGSDDNGQSGAEAGNDAPGAGADNDAGAGAPGGPAGPGGPGLG